MDNPVPVNGDKRVRPGRRLSLRQVLDFQQIAHDAALVFMHNHPSGDPRSNAKADFEKDNTNLKDMFACGDCFRVQSLVVWAFNEGRGAASECDRYLMGCPDLP